jgi:hypothetical protein
MEEEPRGGDAAMADTSDSDFDGLVGKQEERLIGGMSSSYFGLAVNGQLN